MFSILPLTEITRFQKILWILFVLENLCMICLSSLQNYWWRDENMKIAFLHVQNFTTDLYSYIFLGANKHFQRLGLVGIKQPRKREACLLGCTSKHFFCLFVYKFTSQRGVKHYNTSVKIIFQKISFSQRTWKNFLRLT